MMLSDALSYWSASLGTSGLMSHRQSTDEKVKDTRVAMSWCLTDIAAHVTRKNKTL